MSTVYYVIRTHNGDYLSARSPAVTDPFRSFARRFEARADAEVAAAPGERIIKVTRRTPAELREERLRLRALVDKRVFHCDGVGGETCAAIATRACNEGGNYCDEHSDASEDFYDMPGAKEARALNELDAALARRS